MAGGDGFRAVAFHTTTGGVLFIAVPLHDTATTFRNVLAVEGVATLAVLLALGLVAWFVLHLGVRPLDQMAETADAIAAGDLSRRIERAEPRTEAGRLGLALNTMLGEIEEAMDQRAASEERLRRFVADASARAAHAAHVDPRLRRAVAPGRPARRAGDLADAMRRMEKESARMGVLVDEMLLLARLDQGRPLEAEPVDLARLVADAVADARAVEPDRPISPRGPGPPRRPRGRGAPAPGRVQPARQPAGAHAPRHAGASPRGRRRRRLPCSRSRTTVRASVPTPDGCSNGSTGPTRLAPAPVVGRASGCRSWPPSARPTGDGPSPVRPPPGGPASGSRSPCAPSLSAPRRPTISCSRSPPSSHETLRLLLVCSHPIEVYSQLCPTTAPNPPPMTSRRCTRRGRWTSRQLAVIPPLLAVVALIVVACGGGSSKPSSTTPTTAAASGATATTGGGGRLNGAALSAFRTCLQQHGVTLADPTHDHPG